MLRVVHITNPTAPVRSKKVDHRTKAYMDNLKREFLLEHNAKIAKQNLK